MTRTLTCLMLTALLTAVALPAQAQEQRAPRMMDRLVQGLDLSERQQEKLQNAIEEAESDPSLWTVAAALQDVLTDEQREQLLERGKVAQAYQRGVRDGGRRGSRQEGTAPQRRYRDMRGVQVQPHRMLGGIPDLTDEQKAALQEIGDAQRDAMQSFREDAGDELDRDAFQQRMQELNEGSRERVEQILTDEQLQWLEKNRGPRVAAERGMPQRQGMRGDRGGTMRGNRAPVRSGRFQDRGNTSGADMADVLDLSEEQQEILAIHRALVAGTVAARTRAGGNARFGR